MNARLFHKGTQPNTTIEDRKIAKEYHDAEVSLDKEIEKHYRLLGEYYNKTAIAKDIANVRKERK